MKLNHEDHDPLRSFAGLRILELYTRVPSFPLAYAVATLRGLSDL